MSIHVRSSISSDMAYFVTPMLIDNDSVLHGKDFIWYIKVM